jgi:hypothetical protein
MCRQITALIYAESVAKTDVAGTDGMRQCPPRTLHFLAQNEARPGPHRAGLVGSQSRAERGEHVAAIVRFVHNANGGEGTQQT